VEAKLFFKPFRPLVKCSSTPGELSGQGSLNTQGVDRPVEFRELGGM